MNILTCSFMIDSSPVTKRRFLTAVFAVLLASAASVAGAVTTGPHVVRSVIIGGYGVHVEVSPAPAGCTSEWTGTQLVLLKSSPLFKELLAGLLAAHGQGRSILVWHEVQGNGNCSFGNQRWIDAIQIK
jgi:hypothetical protein